MLPLGDSNQGPLVQHACITAHDTCLWHVGGMLVGCLTYQTNCWFAPLTLHKKINYLMEIDCHLLVLSRSKDKSVQHNYQVIAL